MERHVEGSDSFGEFEQRDADGAESADGARSSRGSQGPSARASGRGEVLAPALARDGGEARQRLRSVMHKRGRTIGSFVKLQEHDTEVVIDHGARYRGVELQEPDTEVKLQEPDTEASWSEDMPLNEASIEGTLPQGTVFGSIKRIRTTINMYAGHLASTGWHDLFKVPTMQALERRLKQHEQSVEGKFHLDVVISYRQLKQRVSSLILANKSLRQWLETRNESHLVQTAKHMSPLMKYLSKVGLELAPDMQMVMLFARFYACVDADASVSNALRDMDVEAFVSLYDKFKSDDACNQPARVAQPTPLVKVEVGDADGDGEKTAKRKRQPKKDASKLLGPVLAEPAYAQLARLLTNAMKTFLFNLPSNLHEQHEELARALREVAAVHECWVEKMGATDEVAKHVGHILHALLQVLRCCSHEESARPSAQEVRVARRVVLTSLKRSEVFDDLSKAMVTYDFPKHAMEASKAYAAVGLEDETAEKLLWDTIAEFECFMAAAFENIGEWVTSGNAGNPQSMDSLTKLLDLVHANNQALVNSSGRLSSATLQAKLEDLELILQNQCEVLQLANYVMLDNVHRALFPKWELRPRSPAHFPRELASSAAVAHVKEELPDADGVADGAVDAAEAQGVAPVPCVGDIRLHMVDMQCLQQVAQQCQSSTASFAACLQHLLRGVQRAVDIVDSRVGSAFKGKFQGMDNPLEMATIVSDNAESLHKVFQYVTLCVELRDAPQRGFDANSSRGAEYNTFVEDLCAFSRIHLKEGMAADGLFESPWCATGSTMLRSFRGCFADFVTQYGEDVYVTHAANFVKERVLAILQACVKVSMVHTSVVEDQAEKTLFGHLIAEPSPNMLAWESQSRFPLTGGADDLDCFGDDVSEVAFKDLRAFAGAVDLKEVAIPDVTKASADASTLTMQQATLLFDLVVLVRRIAKALANLHKFLFLRLAGGSEFGADETFGFITFLLRLLQHWLSVLDESIESNEVVELEKAMVPLPSSIGVIREWKKLVSKLAGRGLVALLGLFSNQASKDTGACRASCPSWMACFPEGMYNSTLADKVLRNKLGPLIKNHTQLHTTLRRMSDAARLLDVQPRLQEHDLTSESIAVALSTLSECSVAAAVITGHDILSSTHDSTTKQRASTFLAKHRVPKNADIPEAFWEEFEHLAECAAGGPAPAGKAHASCSGTPSKGVKRELQEALRRALARKARPAQRVDPSPAVPWRPRRLVPQAAPQQS